jgi:hypothetical protein
MHGWDGPIGVFRFKYRSKGLSSSSFAKITGADLQTQDDLQKELIIPRTPSPEPPGPPSAAALTSEQKIRLARMKHDDIEMLKLLTGANTNAPDQDSTSHIRSFEELSSEEIDLLALQKHAEMTASCLSFTN